MSKSGQEFVASKYGAGATLYAMCKAMGIPLTEEQEKFQEYLERKYGMFRSEYPIYDEKSDEVYKP